MALRNIVVVGGSYVGTNTAQQLAARFHDRFRVVLIEKNSHFNHLFAFPRFAVTADVPTAKAFIPYQPGTFAAAPPGAGNTVLQAAAVAVAESAVHLDRTVVLDGQPVDAVPYAFLVLATGTDAVPPARMPSTEKRDGVAYLRRHAADLARRSRVVIIGGGAVGVQMATDLKDLYPDKSVTLVHSRPRLMNRFAPALDALVKARCAELGVALQLGSRVRLPAAGAAAGYPNDGRAFVVECEDGTRIPADMAIVANGLVPQSALLRGLAPDAVGPDGYVRVQPSLQIADPRYPNIFAVGDVAATGAAKAARPGGKQAALVVANIEHILQNEPLDALDTSDPHAIHLTLGITKNVIFRNPASPTAQAEIVHRDDGVLDMGIDGVWTRRGGGPDANL